MSSWELCVRCVFISIAFYVGFFGPEYHCISLRKWCPVLKQAWVTSLQGFLPKRRPILKTGTAHIGNQPWREMLNKGLKTFCWTRSRKVPSKHSSAKLSWLWRKCLNFLSCQSLEGVPSYHQNTQRNLKRSSISSDKLPNLNSALAQGVLESVWGRSC